MTPSKTDGFPRILTFTAVLAMAALVACVTTPASAAEDDETMTMSDSAGTTTKPAATAPPFARRNPAADFRRGGGDGFLQRLKENAAKLGLTDDQKKELERIEADAREKAREIFTDAGGDREKVRQQMGDVLRDSMQQIREILTIEQQRQLREIMEQGGGFRRPGPRDDEMMDDRRRPAGAAKPDRKGPAANPAPVAAKREAVDPATVEFKRLDGKTVPVSTYKGKPLVLVFGSYSCPNFRESVKAIDDLQLHYGTKANFLLVYTKEAHPAGGWEVQRNKDAEISIQPHKDEAARLAAAKQARTTLGLSIPTAVDSMDDQIATAFDAFPNGCVILDREGKVAARQKWAEAHGIRAMLDDLSPTKSPASQASAD